MSLVFKVLCTIALLIQAQVAPTNQNKNAQNICVVNKDVFKCIRDSQRLEKLTKAIFVLRDCTKWNKKIVSSILKSINEKIIPYKEVQCSEDTKTETILADSSVFDTVRKEAIALNPIKRPFFRSAMLYDIKAEYDISDSEIHIVFNNYTSGGNFATYRTEKQNQIKHNSYRKFNCIIQVGDTKLKGEKDGLKKFQSDLDELSKQYEKLYIKPSFWTKITQVWELPYVQATLKTILVTSFCISMYSLKLQATEVAPNVVEAKNAVIELNKVAVQVLDNVGDVKIIVDSSEEIVHQMLEESQDYFKDRSYQQVTDIIEQAKKETNMYFQSARDQLDYMNAILTNNTVTINRFIATDMIKINELSKLFNVSNSEIKKINTTVTDAANKITGFIGTYKDQLQNIASSAAQVNNNTGSLVLRYSALEGEMSNGIDLLNKTVTLQQSISDYIKKTQELSERIDSDVIQSLPVVLGDRKVIAEYIVKNATEFNKQAVIMNQEYSGTNTKLLGIFDRLRIKTRPIGYGSRTSGESLDQLDGDKVSNISGRKDIEDCWKNNVYDQACTGIMYPTIVEYDNINYNTVGIYNLSETGIQPIARIYKITTPVQADQIFEDVDTNTHVNSVSNSTQRIHQVSESNKYFIDLIKNHMKYTGDALTTQKNLNGNDTTWLPGNITIPDNATMFDTNVLVRNVVVDANDIDDAMIANENATLAQILAVQNSGAKEIKTTTDKIKSVLQEQQLQLQNMTVRQDGVDNSGLLQKSVQNLSQLKTDMGKVDGSIGNINANVKKIDQELQSMLGNRTYNGLQNNGNSINKLHEKWQNKVTEIKSSATSIINKTFDILNECKNDKDNCSANLSVCKSDKDNCSTNLTNCSANLTNCTANLTNCADNRNRFVSLIMARVNRFITNDTLSTCENVQCLTNKTVKYGLASNVNELNCSVEQNDIDQTFTALNVQEVGRFVVSTCCELINAARDWCFIKNYTNLSNIMPKQCDGYENMIIPSVCRNLYKAFE